MTAPLPPAKAEDCLFATDQVVRHIKTGTLYEVFSTPTANLRLEATGDWAYAYREYNGDARQGYPIWVRGKAEMEDGRFELTNLKPKPLEI